MGLGDMMNTDRQHVDRTTPRAFFGKSSVHRAFPVNEFVTTSFLFPLQGFYSIQTHNASHMILRYYTIQGWWVRESIPLNDDRGSIEDSSHPLSAVLSEEPTVLDP